MIALKEFIVKRRHIDFNDLPGMARVYTAFDVDKELMVGHALVIHVNNEALLWDIKVDKKYQRMGFATNMIFAMQNEFNNIVTGWYSEAGKHLCLKCGFKISNSGKVPKLIWEKKKGGE